MRYNQPRLLVSIEEDGWDFLHPIKKKTEDYAEVTDDAKGSAVGLS